VIQRARFVAVAAMCVATFQVSAQSRPSVASDSALLRTMLRTAVREGLTTAHGADAPQLVCVGRPTPSVEGTYTFEFGYHQHELSGGHWRCDVRRRADAWKIASCQLLGVA
jgi:hypothetical protein